jgi:hypothetical protein
VDRARDERDLPVEISGRERVYSGTQQRRGGRVERDNELTRRPEDREGNRRKYAAVQPHGSPATSAIAMLIGIPIATINAPLETIDAPQGAESRAKDEPQDGASTGSPPRSQVRGRTGPPSTGSEVSSFMGCATAPPRCS